MATRSGLLAEIADDLARTDLSTQIIAAVNNAIEHYQDQRFFFTETRSTTFATVSGTATYSSSDAAAIPTFVKLDAVFSNPSGIVPLELERCDPIDIEWLISSAGTGTGQPYSYAYFEQSFRFYPVPNAVYTIRPIGVIKKAAPTDNTANVWIDNAYELIRCRAKAYLAIHVLRDPDLLMLMAGPDGMGGAIGAALEKIRAETSKKIGSGRITPTDF